MSRSSRPGSSNQLRRVGLAAMIALSLGLVVIVVGQGFSSIGVVRALERPDVVVSAIANERVSSAVKAPSFTSNSVGPKLRYGWPSTNSTKL